MKKKISFLSGLKKLSSDNIMTGRIETTLSCSLLFAISFTCFYLFGTGIFFYQENNSLFIFSSDYFKNFAAKPGGVLHYAGNFLIQFYHSPFYGSLIISILLVLCFIVLQKIAGVLNGGKPFPILLILIPSCLLLLLQSRYDFHVYNILGFLIVLCLFLYTICSAGKAVLIALIILFPGLYYLTGSFAFVFLGLFIVHNIVFHKGKRRILWPLLVFTAAVVTFVIFEYVIFLQPARKMLAYPLFINSAARLTTFLLLFSGFIILLPLVIKTGVALLTNKQFKPYVSSVSMLTVFSLTVFILIKNYDRDTDNALRIEKMAYNREWDKMIRLQEKVQSSNIIQQFYYNLALAEKGELCSRMFFGRQSYGSISLTLKRDDEQSIRAMYFYYAVGLTGEAHHLAYELMVQHGWRPETIKMLIKTELINGNFKIAARYINVLKKTLHYKKWAKKYEMMLFKPDLVNSDPEIGEKIKLIPKNDFFIFTDDFRNIETLLLANPGNRLAFEYKMAKLLMEKDIMAVGSEIKKLKGLGYAHIPRHIEEALVSLVNVTREFPDLGGLSVSTDTEQRFIRYFSNLKSFKGNRDLVEKGITKADRNTYWYYLQFGLIKSDFFKGGAVDNSIY